MRREAVTSARPVTVETTRGAVACRAYGPAGAERAAVWVGGVGGGWDTPARDLYPRLADDLVSAGIASLRLRFRHPTLLQEAEFDVLAGLEHLTANGVRRVALVGHSFGGAVVVRAAARSPAARTVVALATQGYGADAAARLAPGCSLLLVHGTADAVLPARSSEYVYELARDRKRLVLFEGAGHGLDEAADEVGELVRAWIVAELA